MGFELGLMGQAFFRGGLLTLHAAVNRFSAAGTLRCPSRKIGIFRGGHLKVPATENRFTMAGKIVCHGK